MDDKNKNELVEFIDIVHTNSKIQGTICILTNENGYSFKSNYSIGETVAILEVYKFRLLNNMHGKDIVNGVN